MGTACSLEDNVYDKHHSLDIAHEVPERKGASVKTVKMMVPV